jgi:hypothetical protein
MAEQVAPPAMRLADRAAELLVAESLFSYTGHVQNHFSGDLR